MEDTKKAAIENLKQAHKYFNKILSELTEKQITQEKIDNEWTTKDVIAHLSAWNRECLEEIKRILEGQATWNKLYTTKKDDDAFNKAELAKRKDQAWNEIKDEWENSYERLIKRVEELSDDKWNYSLEHEVWADTQEEAGSPVTVKSLFSVEIAGNAHEMEHAKAVAEFFK